MGNEINEERLKMIDAKGLREYEIKKAIEEKKKAITEKKVIHK
jgi:hypothetical protein